MEDRIEVGDTVTVHFGSGSANSLFHAKILYSPCEYGDAWHLRTVDGTIVYVQRYEAMYLEPDYV